MYKRKVLEINGDYAQISLPIVKFPPFKLRAALIEKDPVVWLHCIETYVTYMEYLLFENNVEKIDDLTYNNLCIFIRSYLHEMAGERSRLLSLGMNHDVAEQLSILKELILTLIKKCGLLHLQIYGESLWDLVKVYVDDNDTQVRSLLDGSVRPSINTQKVQLNRIPQVQQYLKQLVESGMFNRIDLKSFENLLSEKPLKASKFGKRFLNAAWLETLEVWWAKGQGKFSSIARELETVTLLSASAEDIVEVSKELGISSVDTLSLYPLLGCFLIDEKFQSMSPGLSGLLPHFHLALQDEETNDESSYITEESLVAMGELLPSLSKDQLTHLLQKFEGNAELATNAVFEDPTLIDAIAREISTEGRSSTDEESDGPEELELSGHTAAAFENDSNKVVRKQVPDELRNKTLTWAMQLMYQADEDERDDTYDEAEVSHSVGKISLEDSGESSSIAATSSTLSNYDNIERYLWDLLKQDKTLFERSKRGSKVRKDMKKDTTWSDEQIEGWARMLERSPQRARILEEKYMFRGNVKTGKRAYVKKEQQNDDNSQAKREQKPSRPTNTNSQKPADKKRQQARNEKKKSSRANHNRKAGHDKKLSKAGV